MMKFLLQPSSFSASPGENIIIVIMDAKRGKSGIDTLNWAINNVVRPKDKLVVLGVLSELGKKTSSASCFPFHVGIVSKTWLNLEFQGQPETSPRVIKEEIDRKREEYQRILQPYYRHCKKIEVNLDFTLAAGYDPRQITIEEAHKLSPRWIVLDSFLKKEKVYIYGHVACNIAVMKSKGLATLMPLRTPDDHNNEQWWNNNEYEVSEEEQNKETDDDQEFEDEDEEEICVEEEECFDDEKQIINPPPITPNSPCWRPLAWRMGFPRILSIEEIENMTNGFVDETIVTSSRHGKHIIYEGIFLGTPVFVKRLPKDNDELWSVLEIISHVRHHSILGLIGHCCSDESMFLVYDFPCSCTLEMNLLDDECSKRISWKMRWNVALEIGAGLRYLQEECENGPIVDISISSSEVVIFHGSSAMLCILNRARMLKGGTANQNEDFSAKCGEDDREENKHILADIRGYGKLLIELITGKTEKYLQEQDNSHHSSFDWAMPFLEDEDALKEVMDTRLVPDTSDDDVRLVENMARAALVCLKSDVNDRLTMSKVLAVVRGDQDGTTVISL